MTEDTPSQMPATQIHTVIYSIPQIAPYSNANASLHRWSPYTTYALRQTYIFLSTPSPQKINTHSVIEEEKDDLPITTTAWQWWWYERIPVGIGAERSAAVRTVPSCASGRNILLRHVHAGKMEPFLVALMESVGLSWDWGG
jgi:heme/copper-type cytochrome/quinol oxidase subunit 2